MHTVDEIVQAISALQRTDTTALVAIDGHGGSGKSTLACALGNRLTDATIVHCDHLRAAPDKPAWRVRLNAQVIEPLLNGRPARYAHEDWITGELIEWCTIEAGGFVIIEGISVLHSDLVAPWDLKIWVDCPPDLRLKRGSSSRR